MRNIIGAVLLLVGVCAQESRTHAETIDDVITEYADLLLLADLCPMLTFNSTGGHFPQFFAAKKFNQKLIVEGEPYFADLKLAEKAALEKRMSSSGRFNCRDAVKKYGEQGEGVPGIISATRYNFDIISNKPMREAADITLNGIVADEICPVRPDSTSKRTAYLVVESPIPFMTAIVERDTSYNILNGWRLKETFERRKKLTIDENCLFADTVMEQF